MHRLLGLAAFFILVLLAYAPAASACEGCYEYWNYEANGWCKYCDVAPCGWFHCEIRTFIAVGDYCTGDDAGCFEYRRHCAAEPQVEMPRRPDQTWRLARVQVRDATTASVAPKV